MSRRAIDLQGERLVGALEDGQHPGVDEVAAHRELLGVAHAAVDLHGLACHPLGGPADVGLDHGRLERALALRHQAGDVVRALARGLDDHRHAAELGLGQLVVADGRAEHLALGGVGEAGLVGGLHHAERPGRRLQPAVLEALHLEVEALAQPVGAADEVGLGHEPVLEAPARRSACPGSRGCRWGVPPGVPAPGRPGGRASSSWVNTKPWPSPRGFSTTNMREAAVGQGPVGVGAGQQHEHVGPGGEGAPGLDAVDDPAALRPALAAVTMPATSEPKSGSVTATAARTSAEASLGSHCFFCSSVPP